MAPERTEHTGVTSTRHAGTPKLLDSIKERDKSKGLLHCVGLLILGVTPAEVSEQKVPTPPSPSPQAHRAVTFSLVVHPTTPALYLTTLPTASLPSSLGPIGSSPADSSTPICQVFAAPLTPYPLAPTRWPLPAGFSPMHLASRASVGSAQEPRYWCAAT